MVESPIDQLLAGDLMEHIKTTYHVLIPDGVDEAAIKYLQAEEGIRVTAPGKMTRDETMEMIREADALIVRSRTRVDAEMLNAAPRLKVIVRAGVGVDNIDLTAASRHGVVVMNTPDGNTNATAEHTISLMLALARNIPWSHKSMEAGRWDRQVLKGVELRGKVLGIIGFGRVGSTVARLARAFSMQVIVYDPNCSMEQCYCAERLDIEMVELDELYERADFICLHTILCDETRHLINTDSISRMKPGVRIINTARGALILEEDLAEAIKSGHVAGAALDVYSKEPPPKDHPLVGLPGVVHTPHLAASTKSAQIEVAVQAAEQVVYALKDGEYCNVKNPEVLEAEVVLEPV